ncbi:helix-turn-helix domain-containing protein [Streptomyces sp. 3N207]|uniref:helix-turn-helix domain-containing protein n=1 Tax=Streptomyces sp. 3N207 TaxID=3457417 RepID=UPI003FD2E5D6
MLRLHFAAGDLARTRVADGPDPLWESVLSLHRLRDTRRDSVLSGWREGVQRDGTEPLRRLLPLVPVRGYFPDFLTPAAGTAGFEEGLEAVLATPRTRLRAEIGMLAQSHSLTGWASSVGEGSARTLDRLGAALRDYRNLALDSWWPRIVSQVDADRMWRCRTQLLHGTEELLRTFEPAIRWRPPVLEADYPVELETRLEGRGLLLIPSYFCRRTPVALADPGLPPVLVYPARMPESPAAVSPVKLARLLGHTRAAVLQSLHGGCSTSELAHRAGVSVSSASEHAAVLRDAGLISSNRRSNTVRHALTFMGMALLGDRTSGVVRRPVGAAQPAALCRPSMLDAVTGPVSR